MRDDNRFGVGEATVRGTILNMGRVLDWFVAGMAGIGLAMGISMPTALAAGEARTLSVYNIHTKETLTVTYKKDGAYIPEAMKQINHIMRDWRRDLPTKMDPDLIDLIWELHTDLGSKEPVHLISGFRSKRTNERLRRRGGGQARNSQHIQGKAADIHFPDVSVRDMRNSALIRERGGVGYYPKSGKPFVHLDTSRVRHWPRLPRRELALLFPSGKTQHRPRDGKAITKRDVRVAVARMKRLGRPLPVVYGRNNRKPAPQRRMFASAAPTGVPLGIGDTLRKAGLGSSWGAQTKPQAQAGVKLASADASRGGHAARGSRPALIPARVEPALPPDYDPEHPEELSYEPTSVLPLMSDTSVSYNANVAALSHPVIEETDYLLTVPDRGMPVRFRAGSTFAELKYTNRFTGEAIMDVLAAAPDVPRPDRKPARRYRTAGL